jgi:heme oxygenase
LRDELREHTHQQHERLHEHSSFLSMFTQSLSMADYRALIRRLHGFYLPLDRAISHVIANEGGGTGEFRYANRSGLLAQDMLDLGWSAQAIEENLQCTGTSDIVSRETLGGVLYVIEGATLGGARIDRAAHKLLGGDDPAGRRFWSWCRVEGGHRWPMTTRYLQDLEEQGADVSDLKKGASETFRLLADWLAPLDRAYGAGEPRVI